MNLQNIGSIKQITKNLSFNQKILLLSTLFLLLLLPFSVLTAQTRVELRKHAQAPITSPITPTPQYSNPINWQTNYASLQSDGFYIEVGGQKFFANNVNVSVSSDPGSPAYTTLENTWYENGKEMRLYIYFKADAYGWWPFEIRTYNGQSSPDWIYYQVEKLGKAGLGSSIYYQSPIVLEGTSKPSSQRPSYTGRIFFTNLRLKAFLNKVVTPTPTPTYTNHNPQITTLSIPSGYLGRSYQTSIVGIDRDTQDTLTMNITGLPRGLVKGICNFKPGRITCPITGTLRQAGNNFQVQITLTDNKGGKVQKVLRMRVLYP